MDPVLLAIIAAALVLDAAVWLVTYRYQNRRPIEATGMWRDAERMHRQTNSNLAVVTVNLVLVAIGLTFIVAHRALT